MTRSEALEAADKFAYDTVEWFLDHDEVVPLYVIDDTLVFREVRVAFADLRIENRFFPNKLDGE